MQQVRVRALALESDFSDEQRVQNLQLLCTKFQHAADEQLEQLGIDIATQLSGAEFDTLWAIHQNGPLTAGDLPSKTARDFLADLGVVVMVVVKGDDGHWASTQLGHWVYKGLEAVKANPELRDPPAGAMLGDSQSNKEMEEGE